MYNANNDFWDSHIYDQYGGLYYYIMNKSLEHEGVTGENNNSDIMGFAPTIQSIIYNPFLSEDNLNITKIPFDKNYYGNISPDDSDLYVFRATAKAIKSVRSLFTGYLYFNKPAIVSRNWKNESKLQMSQFTKYYLCDYLNSPLEILPEYTPGGNLDIRVSTSLNNRGVYCIYPEGYKGDSQGRFYGILNEMSLDIPVLSSTYSQFLATSKNSFATNINNQLSLNKLNATQSNVKAGVNMFSQLANFDVTAPLNFLDDSINAGLNNALYQDQLKLSNEQIISGALSEVKDMQEAPRSAMSLGNDALFSLAKANYIIELIKQGQNESYYNRLGDYFAMYGYKQNKFMEVNYRNRYYYNYIKTLDSNIVANIPQEYVSKLKKIFNKGVTIWHIDRAGVNMYDYSMDNKEV